MNGESKVHKGSIVYRYTLRSNTIYLNITNRARARANEVKESDGESVWCGFGEPTLRLDIVLNLTRKMKEDYPYIKVRLDTDGLAQIRHKDREVARELKDAGIDSVSISLNAESREKYDELCKPSLSGSYQAVLDFARDCRKYFSQVRLTVVKVEGINIPKCKRIAEELNCDFKVRG